MLQSKTFEPSDSPDLTPSQIAAFYRVVGEDYDQLFIETPPSALSFIYRSLGAYHSLQPAPNDDGYSSPTIPALKRKGYVTWQTIQLLLGPEVHVPLLQKAVQKFDVVDPETGNVFPKLLPKECLPDEPDDEMEKWYETVAQRLQIETEEDGVEQQKVPHVRVRNDHLPRTSADFSGDSADEKHAAASYFSDPLYRKRHTSRPSVVRRVSKQATHFYEDPSRGRLISSVKHILNPFGKSRKVPGRYEDDSLSDDDDDRTPVAPIPPAPRYVSHNSHSSQESHKRPPPRRESSLSSTDSDTDSDAPSRRRTPPLRHRRSHEPATSPREYFPPHYDDRRYSHDVPGPFVQKKEDGPPPLYGPTKSPLFATHVAHMQAHNYYDRRPSYRAHNVRYTPAPAPEVVDPPYPRERDRERDRNRDRDRDGYERYRRRSEELLRERDRERERDGMRDRTRSHDRDRVKDEWDERDERSRDRDVRGGRTHRYVSGMQDGVGGRRYAVEQPWR